MNKIAAIFAAMVVFTILFLCGCSSSPQDPRIGELEKIANGHDYAAKALEVSLNVASTSRNRGYIPGSKHYWELIQETLQRWEKIDMTGTRTMDDIEAIREMVKVIQRFRSKAPTVPPN